MFKTAEITSAALIIRAINHKERQMLFNLINTHPGNNVQTLMKWSKIDSQSQISQQLAVLRMARLVRIEKKERNVHYFVNSEYANRVQDIIHSLFIMLEEV